MRWTPAIILGALALAAIIFLSIYEPLTQGARERQAADRSGLVLAFDPAAVEEIRIVSGETSFALKRRGNRWQFAHKSKDRVDASQVWALLGAAADLRYLDRIEAREFRKDSDWSPYGLRNPKRAIEFVNGGTVSLYLGKDAAGEGRIYVRTGKSRDVYIVEDKLLKLAFRDSGAFRDPRLTDLSPQQIDRVVIRRPAGEIELVQDASGWRIAKPLHARGDEKRIEEYLNRLLGLRILEFVAEDSGDLSEYGIAGGRNEISFFAEGSDRQQTLRFGTSRPGSLFGQFTARDSVYRLPEVAAELLTATPDTFRDRRLLPVNLDMVDRIRLRAAGRELAFARSGDDWTILGDGSKRASAAAIRTLADAVSTAQVSAYRTLAGEPLEKFGLLDPSLRIEFLSVLSENTPEAEAGEQVIASLSFGKVEGDSVYARVGDAPEACTVPAQILTAIPSDPAAWIAP